MLFNILTVVIEPTFPISCHTPPLASPHSSNVLLFINHQIIKVRLVQPEIPEHMFIELTNAVILLVTYIIKIVQTMYQLFHVKEVIVKLLTDLYNFIFYFSLNFKLYLKNIILIVFACVRVCSKKV